MSTSSVSDHVTSTAPLAQLRDVEPEAWRALMDRGGSTADPADATAMQSLAAHILGDHHLGRQIATSGFYPLSAACAGQWPDLAASYQP